MVDSARKAGRRDGLLEACAWLEDAAGQHVRGDVAWRWLQGAADFMRQRAEELGRAQP